MYHLAAAYGLEQKKMMAVSQKICLAAHNGAKYFLFELLKHQQFHEIFTNVSSIKSENGETFDVKVAKYQKIFSTSS